MARDIYLFRQFCINPVTRDPRVIMDWRRSPIPGIAWQSELAGNEKVMLYWHDEDYCQYPVTKGTYIRKEPRAPTATCTNMLLSLLYQAIEQDSNVLDFPSIHRMMRSVKMFATSMHARRCCSDGVRLWQYLRISWPKLTLPPPIVSFQTFGRSTKKRVRIVIHEEWMTMLKKQGKVRVRLPLPMHGTPLNIVLYALGTHGQVDYRRKMDINTFTARVSGNKFADKSTPFLPHGSWLVAMNWFKDHGGRLEYQRTPYKFGINHLGKPGLVPSTTFSITHVRRPR